MRLDEHLFEDYEEQGDVIIDNYDDTIFDDTAKEQEKNMSDIEARLAGLASDEELVIKMRTEVPGVTDRGFNTLHIKKGDGGWYRLWNTNDSNEKVNDQISSYDNALYWATIASQAQTDGVEIGKEDGEIVVDESLQEDETYQYDDFKFVLVKPFKYEPTNSLKILCTNVYDNDGEPISCGYIDKEATYDDVVKNLETEVVDVLKEKVASGEYTFNNYKYNVNDYYKKFYEDLQENIEVVSDGIVEPYGKPTEEQVSNSYQNQLISLINGEWETIQDYNDLVNMLQEVDEYKEYIPVIEGIIKDEHNHIGNLQNVLDRLNPNSDREIDAGHEEADKILDK